MLEIELILRVCIEEKITVGQYFFLYLLHRGDHTLEENKSLFKQYCKSCGFFDIDEIRQLSHRRFLEDFNDIRSGKTLPEMFMVHDDVKQRLFTTPEIEGEELWNSYPARFSLGDDKFFLGRSGATKDVVIMEYLAKVGKAKHRFVMDRLELFKQLVEEGQLPGRKIIDFVREEIWEQLEGFKSEKPKVRSYDTDL
tara:strand:+ start:180 stop:767 length:588 start_codon:yes stop_codon:yes gene_type:complete